MEAAAAVAAVAAVAALVRKALGLLPLERLKPRLRLRLLLSQEVGIWVEGSSGETTCSRPLGQKVQFSIGRFAADVSSMLLNELAQRREA